MVEGNWLERARKALGGQPVTMVALAVLVTVSGAGLAAPWLAVHVIGFSPSEQHTGLQFAPPGVSDVSLDHPEYDGDKDVFKRLDADGDGLLRCTIERKGIDATKLEALALRRFSDLPTPLRVPLGEVMKTFAAPLRCPELDRFSSRWRAWDLLINVHDRDGDGALSAAELPMLRDALDHRLRPGLATASAQGRWSDLSFNDLDRDRDRVVRRDEIISATRACRLSSEDLLARFDTNGDLAISAQEFPGLPRLRTFVLHT